MRTKYAKVFLISKTINHKARTMLEINGSYGEGGGQILRSSLALSMITQTPFRLHSIRAGRKVPGLRKQHVTCVKAAAEICNAQVTGVQLGSSEVTFVPGDVTPGEYRFATGSAGSAMLVFQTIFPALMTEKEKTTVTIQGGTHNLMAPPFEFIRDSFLGFLASHGVKCTAELHRYGYYPAGGGEVTFSVLPSEVKPFFVDGSGEIESLSAISYIIRKPRTVMDEQLEEIAEVLPGSYCEGIISPAVGPGNHVAVSVKREDHVQVFTGFGKRNRSHTITARVVAQRAKQFLESGCFCDSHLADQLLIPLYLAGSGSFTCPEPTLHTTTNAKVIEWFTGVRIAIDQVDDAVWKISL